MDAESLNNPLPHVELHADGACLGNPGPGGWACIIVPIDPTGPEQVLSGGQASTTNNRMELQAVIEGLSSLPDGARVDLHADSQYVLKGLDEWLDNWIARGWRTSSRKPVKNEAQWRVLDTERARLTLTYTWVKGHDGHDYNERCDLLAKREAERIAEEIAT